MKALTIFITLVVGALLGAAMVTLLPFNAQVASSSSSDEKKPLYWVAPMDPNYRRDKPGKSPMGMDLIPFYGDEEADSPGTVKVSPEVMHNLGLRTAKVSYQRFEHQIETVGYVRINEHEVQHVHPRVQGWVEKLYVKAVGDKVGKGQALYDIYSPELVNAQEELLIALKRNNKLLIEAASERLKALQLTAKQITQLKKSGKVKQRLTIYAPKSGVVNELKVAEGFYVKPAMTMMSIVDLSSVWVEAKVFERQASLVSEDMPATIKLGYNPIDSRSGKVDYIYPTLDANSRSLTLRIEVDNPDLQLKPNMFVDVTLKHSDNNKVLQIPADAVIRSGLQNRVVQQLEPGKLKSIEVEIGRIHNGSAEVLKGLRKGEVVVSSAQFMIDSESSKTSDFKRIDAAVSKKKKEKPKSVWVEAKFNSLDLNNNKVNVNHPPIPEWKWPEMDMNFQVDDKLDTSKLKAGLSAHIEITKKDKRTYVITGLHIPEQALKVKDKNKAKEAMDSVLVMASFNSIDADNFKANIKHPPIAQWKWPEMDMNFKLDKSLDLSDIQPGTQAHIEISKFDKRTYIVTQIHVISQPHTGH